MSQSNIRTMQDDIQEEKNKNKQSLLGLNRTARRENTVGTGTVSSPEASFNNQPSNSRPGATYTTSATATQTNLQSSTPVHQTQNLVPKPGRSQGSPMRPQIQNQPNVSTPPAPLSDSTAKVHKPGSRFQAQANFGDNKSRVTNIVNPQKFPRRSAAPTKPKFSDITGGSKPNTSSQPPRSHFQNPGSDAELTNLSRRISGAMHGPKPNRTQPGTSALNATQSTQPKTNDSTLNPQKDLERLVKRIGKDLKNHSSAPTDTSLPITPDALSASEASPVATPEPQTASPYWSNLKKEIEESEAMNLTAEEIIQKEDAVISPSSPAKVSRSEAIAVGSTRANPQYTPQPAPAAPNKIPSQTGPTSSTISTAPSSSATKLSPNPAPKPRPIANPSVPTKAAGPRRNETSLQNSKTLGSSDQAIELKTAVSSQKVAPTPATSTPISSISMDSVSPASAPVKTPATAPATVPDNAKSDVTSAPPISSPAPDKPSDAAVTAEPTGIIKPQPRPLPRFNQVAETAYKTPENRLVSDKQAFYSSLHNRTERPRVAQQNLDRFREILEEQKQSAAPLAENEAQNLKNHLEQKYGLAQKKTLPFKKIGIVLLALVVLWGGALFVVFNKAKTPAEPTQNIQEGKNIPIIETNLSQEVMVTQNQIQGINYFDRSAAPWNSYSEGEVIRLNIVDNNSKKRLQRDDALRTLLGENHFNNLPSGFLPLINEEYNIIAFKSRGGLRLGLAFSFDSTRTADLRKTLRGWETTDNRARRMHYVLQKLFLNAPFSETSTYAFDGFEKESIEVRYVNLPDSNTAMDYFIYNNILTFTTSKDTTENMLDALR